MAMNVERKYDPLRARGYEQLNLLGLGGFGEVWHCRRCDGAEVAIKIVKYSEKEEERVQREAQILERLSHPGVVKFHSVFTEETQESQNLERRDRRCITAPAGFASCLAGKTEGSEGSTTWCDNSACLNSYCCSDSESEHDDGIAFLASEASANGSASSVCDTLEHSAVRRTDAQTQAPRARILSGSTTRQTASHATGAAQTKKLLYLEMEFCGGGSLLSWLQRRNARSTSEGLDGHHVEYAEAIRIFSECASALAYIHEQACVHRDVKPGNIFLDADSSVHIGDFGLALDFGSADVMPLEKRGTTVGTPAYASPEQLAGESCSFPADIYSLGVVLAELLCPVVTQMERCLMIENLRAGSGLPKQVREAFPEASKLVTQMTDPDPKLRPDARDVMLLCQALRDEVRA